MDLPFQSNLVPENIGCFINMYKLYNTTANIEDEGWCLKWQNLLVHLVVCHQLAVNDATFHVMGQGVLDDLCDQGDTILGSTKAIELNKKTT